MDFICENFYIIGDILDLLLTVTFIYLVFCIISIVKNINIKVGNKIEIKSKKHLEIKYCTTAPDLYPDLNDNFAYDYAACFDLLSNDEIAINPWKIGSVDTGLIFCLPFEYELQARPKSGLSKKGCHIELGTIDGDYRGKVFATIYNFSDEPIVIKRGQKICQGRIDKLSFIPRNGDKFIKVKSVDDFDPELKCTSRGENGFGSSGV